MIIELGIHVIQTYAPTLLTLLPVLSGPVVERAVSSTLELQMAILRVVACGA